MLPSLWGIAMQSAPHNKTKYYVTAEPTLFIFLPGYPGIHIYALSSLTFAESHWSEWDAWVCNEGTNVRRRTRSCSIKSYLTLPTCPYLDSEEETDFCISK